MKHFAPPKRKLIELLSLPVFSGVFFLLHSDFDAIILFNFGFIWNWSASNELSSIFENRRYRMSLLKTVVNLQTTIQKPFSRAPEFVKLLLRSLPAGTFWSLVIYLNDSIMPWWATFIGSATFELLQVELDYLRRRKGLPPELPEEV